MSISSLLATDGQTTQKKTLVIGGVVLLLVLSLATVAYAFSSYLKTAALLSGKKTAVTTPSSAVSRGVAAIKVPVVNVAYFDAKNTDLKFATNFGGNWATARVDSAGNVGQDASLAVDSKGKMHIAYYDDASRYDLKYATNASGSWVTSTIDSVGNTGWYTSIAVDGNDKVHIAYLDNTNKDLKYATNTSGAWVKSIVDKGTLASDLPGRYISLALDGGGKAHIGYQYLRSGMIGSLKYATNMTGVWVTSTVDVETNAGFGVSTKVDALGKVHFSYLGNSFPKYASNVTGLWMPAVIDSQVMRGVSGTVGFNTSLALDTGNKAYACFAAGLNLNGYKLKCVSNVSGKWLPIITTGGTKSGMYNSLGIDDKNNLYVSYYDTNKRTLELSTNASGSWVSSTIDAESPVGTWTSLAMSYNYVLPPTTPPSPYGPYLPYTPPTSVPPTPYAVEPTPIVTPTPDPTIAPTVPPDPYAAVDSGRPTRPIDNTRI